MTETDAPLPPDTGIIAPDDPDGELLYAAWVIIANAYGGDWASAPDEWREAAEAWRARRIARLDPPRATDADSTTPAPATPTPDPALFGRLEQRRRAIREAVSRFGPMELHALRDARADDGGWQPLDLAGVAQLDRIEQVIAWIIDRYRNTPLGHTVAWSDDDGMRTATCRHCVWTFTADVARVDAAVSDHVFARYGVGDLVLGTWAAPR